MSRQSRSLIVIVVAVLVASASSYGIYRAISRIPPRNVEIATMHAVVAAKPLGIGTRVTKDMVKLVDWPAKTPLQGGFEDLDEVVDRGLIAAVVENEPISESKLAPKEAGAGLPPSIPPGMRAMSVKVNDVIGVAGFATPGTRVDLLVIVKQKDDTVSRLVAENVQVLTAGTRFDQENSKDSKPVPSTVVTLLVTPTDAERIALAQNQGQIMLALRNPMDTTPTDTHGARTASLFGAPAPVPEAPKQKKAAVVHVAAPEPSPPPPPPTKYHGGNDSRREADGRGGEVT